MKRIFTLLLCLCSLGLEAQYVYDEKEYEKIVTYTLKYDFPVTLDVIMGSNPVYRTSDSFYVLLTNTKYIIFDALERTKYTVDAPRELIAYHLVNKLEAIRNKRIGN